MTTPTQLLEPANEAAGTNGSSNAELSALAAQELVASEGVLYFIGFNKDHRKAAIASTIKHILQGDLPVKGNILTFDDLNTDFSAVTSTHSVVMQSVYDGSKVSMNTAGGFKGDNKQAMRRSPDLVVIGEITDGDLVTAAHSLAAVGEPVFADIEAEDAKSAIIKMLSWFSKDAELDAAANIINYARGFVTQQEFEVDGEFVVIRETLKLSKALKDYLLGFIDGQGVEAMINELQAIIEDGRYGAKSFQHDAQKLIESGVIKAEQVSL